MPLIRLYSRADRNSLALRTGRTYHDVGKALARARAIGSKMLEVEVRDDALPRSKQLLAIFTEGRLLVADPTMQ